MRAVGLFVASLVLLLLVPIAAHAQTPIVIGPNTVLAWDMNAPVAGITPAIVQGYSYAVTVDVAPPTTLANVACVSAPAVAPVLSANSCSVPASQIPMGSHSITMTASTGGLTSLPSTPFTYIDLVIPAPAGLRFK